jgi:hypothetical protein
VGGFFILPPLPQLADLPPIAGEKSRETGRKSAFPMIEKSEIKARKYVFYAKKSPLEKPCRIKEKPSTAPAMAYRI